MTAAREKLSTITFPGLSAMCDTRTVISRDELKARIDRLPRVKLAHLPTPLEYCSRLSTLLGGPEIFIKRDDLTGLAFGGNKTRQLEFLFADIISRGADVIVAGAYTQSNWCRQATAAAAKFGLAVELILIHGEKGAARQGNLLLDDLMGAGITVTDVSDMEALPALLEDKAAALRAEDRKPYVIDPFSPDILARATLGYVEGARELDAQLEALGLEADHIYVAGANVTPAGLLLGTRALGRETRVVGITPIEWEEGRHSDIARIANDAAALLDLELEFAATDVLNFNDYIGERYGVVTPEGRAAFKLLARTEGIILDPVYTSKAMAGLLDHIEQGWIGAGEVVVFLHTGGLPAVFAYADDLLA